MSRILSKSYATAMLILFPALLALGMDSAGKGRKRYLDKGEAVAVQSLAEPHRIWGEKGVRGRILLHFDREIRADSVTASLKGVVADETYVYRAIADNMVRTVYHVVPEQSWQEVANNLRQQGASPSGTGFRVLLEGTPIQVVRAEGIPRFSEKVLININSLDWPADTSNMLAEMLKEKGLKSDLVTIFGPDAERIRKSLAFLYG